MREYSGKGFVALLGRRDEPTDAVAEYCTRLAEALGGRGWDVACVRVPWAEEGWARACRRLARAASAWQGAWVFAQYTALAWSRRGFPVGFLVVLAVLRRQRCRLGVVFHDADGFPGGRWVDRARRTVQRSVMRAAYRLAERTVHNVPVEGLPWLPHPADKAVHIPVGSNVPPLASREDAAPERDRRPTVVVFGVTGGSHAEEEARDIGLAATRAARAVGGLRLVVVGRGSREAEGPLRRVLDGSAIELSVSGLLPAEEVSRTLVRADVLLFVRGPLSSQRSSAIAGLACGLPVVGYRGPHTGPPLTQAGVALAPYRDREALADRLVEVLRDATLRERLRAMTVEAYRRHFSWDAIAERYTEVLGA